MKAKKNEVREERKPIIGVVEVKRLRDAEEPGPAAIARRLGTGQASVHHVLGARK